MHIHYNIICEDEKSGYEYLQKLSKYLRFELCIYKVTIKPISARGGHYDNIKDTYERIYKNKVKEKKLKEKFIVLVDNDTYKRNDLHDLEKYKNKPKYLPNFKFHYFNFEDFLIMHYDDKTFKKWHNICKAHNHFTIPMHKDEYMPLINKYIFPNYDKSSLPEDFFINEQTLKNLFKHNGKYEFKSDFAEFLENIIDKEKLK